MTTRAKLSSAMQSFRAPPPLYPDTPDLVTDSNPSPSDNELPVYSRQPTPPPRSRLHGEPKEFIYDIKTRKGRPWLIMTVLGNRLLSKALPTFIEGHGVRGLVKLSLESGETIHSVTISVAGRIITGANPGESFTFLDISQQLWSNESGHPSNPGPQRFSGKLQGDYTWPYSFDLPRELSLNLSPRNSTPQMFRLPQTFMERHSRASIQYELVLRIRRGRLKPDTKLTASFGFLPIIKPGPPSLLRQLAYQENSPLLGPEADPEGWHTCREVKIRGTLFGQRCVDALCTLSLAKPLCYTRGTVIPCFLVIECRDLQALDLLSSPNAIVLRLQRQVKYHEYAGQTVESVIWKDNVDLTESAMWWPSMEGAPSLDTAKRSLCGEIHLKSNLKPTSAMANFRIDYSVVLFPFDAVAFSSEDNQPLLVEPVQIATAYATGPRPRAYSPPSYESPTPADRYYRTFPTANAFFG